MLLVQGPHQTAGGGGAGERWGEGGAVLLVQGPHQTAGGGGVGERWGEGGTVLLIQGPHQTAGGGGAGEGLCCSYKDLIRLQVGEVWGRGGVREGLCCSYKDLIRLQVGEGRGRGGEGCGASTVQRPIQTAGGGGECCSYCTVTLSDCRWGVVSHASRSTSVLGGKERLVTFARYSWHVGMQLLRDVIAYTFAPTCFDEMFA